jgi:transcription antitermination factor NusG
MITRAVRHARKSTLVRVPLFPGYLFVSLDTSRDRWRSINGTIGVTRIITNGDSPVPVPRGVVEAIQARMDDNGVVERSESLACGQAVKVCDGPFVDFVGRIEHINGPERVRILLELMGRAVIVQTDVRMLVPAD